MPEIGLKPSKSRDSSGVSKEIIKNIQNTIIPSLTKLGKLSLEANKVPICQKMVHIIGIPKGSGSDRLWWKYPYIMVYEKLL